MNLLLNAIESLPEGKVLVAPLNWGMGHATRCTPIIKALCNARKEVVLAGAGVAYDYLKNEFPQLPLINFDGINVRYGKRNQAMAMVRQLPQFVAAVRKEHAQLQQIIHKYDIKVVISDNRFGLWSNDAFCVYITHQLNIIPPKSIALVEPLLHKIHAWFINHYDACWVPDLDDPCNNLAGDLAHKRPLPKNARFVGVLSRFSPSGTEHQAPRYDVLVIVSGPEPHRTMMINRAKDIYQGERTLILCGNPRELTTTHEGTITLMPHIESDLLQELICTTPKIVCRSGYSTIMDLHTLNRHDALLVPTPGQTEQEYLALIHNKTNTNDDSMHC